MNVAFSILFRKLKIMQPYYSHGMMPEFVPTHYAGCSMNVAANIVIEMQSNEIIVRSWLLGKEY